MSLIEAGQETMLVLALAQRNSRKGKKNPKNYCEYYQPDTVLLIAICGIQVEKVIHTARNESWWSEFILSETSHLRGKHLS